MVKTESRVKNSTRNIIYSMIAYIVQIVLGFIVRRYFIYYFGEQYLGLNTLFSNILSLLSLAELGFGTAIVFAMYKPMAENDVEKVRELMQYYKRCYFIIGFVVSALGLLVLPFMSFFETKAPNVDINLYIVYLIFLFNSASSYFFAHRRSLFYVSQRNDLESKVNTCFNVFSTMLQLLVVFFIQNYYLYIAISGVVGLLNNVAVYFLTQKYYTEYLKKPKSYINKESRADINKNIRAMIFHKIGAAVVYSTDSIIIFVMLGSTVLGKYSNYLLITTYVTSLINLITSSVRGSIGNSIAKETKEDNYNLFNKLNFLYMWIVSFCTICIYVLADPFIDVVLTKNNNISLTLDNRILILICINFFTTTSRYMCGTFKECAGLFYQDRYKSIAEAIINLVVSICLTLLLGIEGVIIGTIVSNITTSLWIEPYVLNKHYMKQSTWKYFGRYSIFVIATLITAVITKIVCGLLPYYGFVYLVIRFVICAILPNVLLLICLCWIPEFKNSVVFVKKMISKIKSPKPVLKEEKIEESSNEIYANEELNTEKK